MTKDEALNRFWSQVDRSSPDGCWPWTGPRHDAGYGESRLLGGRRAHRIAWIIARGHIPPGMHVCHHCDNPSCCNPDHLFVATNQDNSLDKHLKGRSRGGSLKGERHPMRKLTDAQVKEIRAAYVKKYGALTALARQYGVSPSAILCIVKNRNWAHVTNEEGGQSCESN